MTSREYTHWNAKRLAVPKTFDWVASCGPSAERMEKGRSGVVRTGIHQEEVFECEFY